MRLVAGLVDLENQGIRHFSMWIQRVERKTCQAMELQNGTGPAMNPGGKLARRRKKLRTFSHPLQVLRLATLFLYSARSKMRQNAPAVLCGLYTCPSHLTFADMGK
jgi:hypothetical protein